MAHELSEDEREAIATAHEHGPEVCDCDAYAPEDGYSPDTICEGLAATFAAVERIIAARTRAVENYSRELERRLREINSIGERADLIDERNAASRRAEAAEQRVDELEAERDDFKEKYAELNAALSWDTTCLNCSNMLTKSYEDYAKREQLESAMLALADEWANGPAAGYDRNEQVELDTEKAHARTLRALVSGPTVLDRCGHGEPEGECPSCAACAACRGECGVCPYTAARDAAGENHD